MCSSAEVFMPGKGKIKLAKRKSAGEKQPDGATPLPVIVGANLRRLRTRQGYSLERLSKLASVSRAMLSQIETGRSVPTILLLLKVANALDVPLATLVSAPPARRTFLLPRARAKILSGSGGRYAVRALFPPEAGCRAEFYEVRIAPGHTEVLEPHEGGTKENVVVIHGRIELKVSGEEPVLLGEGDAALLPGDVARSLRNAGDREATLHLVLDFAGRTHL